MRLGSAVFLLVVAGCGTSPSTDLICSTCGDDRDCGGNPCFADISGARFCGGPCDACPTGYSCQPVQGTGGQIRETCFPDSLSCADSPHPGGDASVAPDDGGAAKADLGGGIPVGGPVGPTGGTVDRLL